MARIDLIDVSKTLTDRDGTAAHRGATFSIRNLTLRIPDGLTMVVLGPSGCGKTTLLKLIAGLIAPDAGEIRYDDVNVTDVRPGDRRIGMVFQNYALYPHLVSRTNVLSYFLFRKKTPGLDALAREKYRRTSELMGVELTDLLDRKPTTLSGGEKQRVALGRCITRDAALFLVDEPFANLDQALREKYRVNLKILLKQYAITTVYVTHDHNEAMILGDLIFVAGFLNLHTGSPPISFVDAADVPTGRSLGDVRLGVRPEDVEVSIAERGDAVRGIVASMLRLPIEKGTLLTIRVGTHEVHARTAGHEHLATGDPAWITFKRYHLFDKASGARVGAGA
ncbi:MAG TPA: ABC transporter ATP-binding protein [Patescibacteria group bacterium]|nr:ABC transporter ATP-binding protein [Patescibacteria group bacterium]